MTRDVATIIVTAEHVLRCKLDTGGQRVLEIINDSNHEFLEIHEVEVLRKNRNVRGQVLSHATVRKSHVGLVLRTETTHEAPGKRRNTWIAKMEHKACVVVLGYDVIGTCHLRGVSDARYLLQHELGLFFPLTQAAAVYGGGAEFSVKVPLAMVNRELVTLLHIERKAANTREAIQTVGSLPNQTTEEPLAEFYGSGIDRNVACPQLPRSDGFGDRGRAGRAGGP